jgi:HlyD family secretion protein
MRIVSLFVMLSLLFSCRSKQEKFTVTVQNITESVYASGVVKARNQYEVYSTVNGIIKKRLVTEGDLVRANQPLIQLVNETSRISTENARLAVENASLDANRDRLNELRINIDLGRSRMQTDSILLSRQRNLWEQQIGTRNELDQRELAYKNSVTAYRAAILRYSDLKRQLEFASKQSGKSLQISSTVLDDYTIKSKVAGKVYSLLKEEGEMVNVQMPVAIIGDAALFYLELQVDEFDISKIRQGQQVLVNMDSYKGQTFEATIEKIDPIMNERSRSFKVEAGFVKSPENLYPNLTAESNIVIRVKQNAITIPNNYLIGDSMVMMENKETRKVVTGIKDYQQSEIISGLKKNEVIVKPLQ